MGRIKRIVDVDFWTDEKVVELFSPEDKLFFIYLLTNPHTTQLGIYQISRKVMAFELGYSIESVSVLIDRFENKYGMIKYMDGEVAIKNSLRHSIIKGGKPVEDLLKKEIQQVKHRSLLKWVFESVKDSKDLNETVQKILPLLNENDNDNDNDVSYHDSYNDSYHDSSQGSVKEVIAYLNEKAGKNYRDSSKHSASLIKARLSEGFSVEDFKRVIDNKVADWKPRKDMEIYLRPETLFGTKFEGYLNENRGEGEKRTVRRLGERD